MWGGMNLGPVQSSKCSYHRTIAPTPNQLISKFPFDKTGSVTISERQLSISASPNPGGV